MTYAILSAQYANADHTAAVLHTQEAGAVLVSQADTPALWVQMLTGAAPSTFVPPDGRPAVLAEYRSLREVYLNRLTGIAVRGDATLAAAAKDMAQGLLDLTDHPSVIAATDGPALKAAVMTRYKELVAAAVAAAPGSKAVFDKVSK